LLYSNVVNVVTGWTLYFLAYFSQVTKNNCYHTQYLNIVSCSLNYGFMTLHFYDTIVLWRCGTMVLKFYGSIVFHGIKMLWFLVLWFHMVLWYYSTLVVWYYGSLSLLYYVVP
jgi:hypothetical protein